MEQYIYPLSAGGGPEIPEPTIADNGKVLGVQNGTYTLLTGITYEPYIDVAKGDLITMNLDGTDRQYRVLKNTDGTVYEVLGMFDSSSTVAFNDGTTDTFADGTVGRKYADGTLDTYLNTTWYGTLSSTAKNAIVDKNVIQDMWYNSNEGNPDYIGKLLSDTTYTMSLKSSATLTVGQRHIYALSVQDVLDYLEVTPSMTAATTTLLGASFNMLLWNTSSAQSTSAAIWLRSAHAAGSQYACMASGYTGHFNYDSNKSHYARPAFQIDLSKIPYTKV